MEIKGTAVKTIPEFVKQRHPGEYLKWVNSLSVASKKIVADVNVPTWYPLQPAAVEPTQKVIEMFFGGDVKMGAWELGRYSADVSLNGIYKLYVKFSSPGHIISRASRIFAAYYNPSKLEASELHPNSVKLLMTEFNQPSEVIEYRIAGWIERALEISGCKGVEVKITESLAKGQSKTVYENSWK
ncbi:MAG: hypothetical protein A2W95_16980 [Bacteroidetes bacterium GWA2_40_14]|nr:MAG: hypothetical protein A2W95_16980 [Bacteroidetes bacterium GWA2_40_14]OFX61024.1 MAG: hypothetical protein A2W84_01815 [Bacteroidetes bacterium GWC2_40_13]HAZ04026.1 hypothetical protein [Marinilabiliales bacterium]